MKSGHGFHRKGLIIIKPDIQNNMECVASLNDGQIDNVPVRYEYEDPRKATPQQRALFFALLGDIYKWSGQPVEDAKQYFYTRFQAHTAGKEISSKDTTTNTVSDATKLITDVIDFIFDNEVPVKKGYELLPRNEEHFQYQSVMHKSCLICGQHADVHHVDTVGMGRDRTKVDHTKHRVMALCRIHHTEYHKIGPSEFCKKYHLTAPGIKLSEEDLKKLGIEGDYVEGG